MKEERILIKNNKYEIPAIFTFPLLEEDRKLPLIIMCHGTGSDKNEAGDGYKIYAKELAKSGIASIRFDFIGTGESTVDYMNYSFTTALSDVSKVFEYASTLKYVDSENIGILGWSQGGSVALLAAEQNKHIKSVVTWAVADNDTLLALGNYEDAIKNGYTTVEFCWRDSLNLSLKWHEDVQNISILNAVKNINAPILALHGSDDNIVSPMISSKIVEASHNKDSKTSIIDGADHTFMIFSNDPSKYKELCRQTTDWFKNTLK